MLTSWKRENGWKMISVEEVCSDLMTIENDINGIVSQLEQQRSWINEMMERAQGTFGDQAAGGSLVNALLYIQNDLAQADNSLYQTQSEIRNYIALLKR